jgi:predicted molibdopterin-dependent oxidoreductase YjgC
MRARTVVTPTVRPGQVFIPMHYVETNRLTHPSFDPYSRQPSYKSGAVEVLRTRQPFLASKRVSDAHLLAQKRRRSR